MVINQFSSIGDILFIEPICRHFWNKNGEKPILPVRDHLMYLQEYINSCRMVPMSKFQLDYESMETSNPDYLPLRFANQIVRGLAPNDHSDFANMMPDKYVLSGLMISIWKSIKIDFNQSRAERLFNELKLPSEYILANQRSQAGEINLNIGTKTPVIQMREIPGYTVLDWYLVMNRAVCNYHVSTSTFYVMQAIHNYCGFDSKSIIYPRPNEDGLQGISKLKADFNYKLIP